MSRKQFMESHGATSKNWRWGWAFVNHDAETVYFGAWDTWTSEGRSLILSMDWERNENGRKQPAFSEAYEYIQLIENNNYKLKTFPIIEDKDFVDETGSGRAKIKRHVEELTGMELQKVNNHYYAVGNHQSVYSTRLQNQQTADIADIYQSNVGQTEKESLVMSRIGQGKFRRNVIDIWGNGESCALTFTQIKELLVASHIVPWSKCESNEQRIDGANGILLCAHVDKLFDRHKISFFKQGNRYVTKLSKSLDARTLKSLGIESGTELAISRMHMNSQVRFDKYISAHNEKFLTLESE